MVGFKHPFPDDGRMLGLVDRTVDRREYLSSIIPGLRYSSPWPWALATGISLSLWAGLTLLVWRLCET